MYQILSEVTANVYRSQPLSSEKENETEIINRMRKLADEWQHSEEKQQLEKIIEKLESDFSIFNQ